MAGGAHPLGEVSDGVEVDGAGEHRVAFGAQLGDHAAHDQSRIPLVVQDLLARGIQSTEGVREPVDRGPRLGVLGRDDRDQGEEAERDDEVGAGAGEPHAVRVAVEDDAHEHLVQDRTDEGDGDEGRRDEDAAHTVIAHAAFGCGDGEDGQCQQGPCHRGGRDALAVTVRTAVDDRDEQERRDRQRHDGAPAREETTASRRIPVR